jgi:hypothetical protein
MPRRDEEEAIRRRYSGKDFEGARQGLSLLGQTNEQTSIAAVI